MLCVCTICYNGILCTLVCMLLYSVLWFGTHHTFGIHCRLYFVQSSMLMYSILYIGIHCIVFLSSVLLCFVLVYIVHFKIVSCGLVSVVHWHALHALHCTFLYVSVSCTLHYALCWYMLYNHIPSTVVCVCGSVSSMLYVVHCYCTCKDRNDQAV